MPRPALPAGVTDDALGRAPPGVRGLLLPGALLGFGLGGFFDGILLHQILQWHHLLSLVDGDAFLDLRTQVLADGLFHAVMYVLTALGLWLLWRRRGAAPRCGARGTLWGGALLGFGVWHILDAVLVHWLLGLHRIRVDVTDPLPWDIGWAVLFGVLPVMVASFLLRRPRGGGAAPVVLVLAVVLAGPAAAFPWGQDRQVVAVFASPADAVGAAAALDASLVWSDASGQVWVMDLPRPRQAWRLYGEGAVLVGGPGLPAGCLGFSRPS